MEITTKYDVGQKLFWLDKRDGIYHINHDDIKSINIGGRAAERYEISYTTRAEKDLYETFGEAKKVALEKQKLENEKYIAIIEDYREPMRF